MTVHHDSSRICMYKHIFQKGFVMLSVSTEHRGRVVNIPTLYSGGLGFKSWLGDWLS
jgi:hypothetical protein